MHKARQLEVEHLNKMHVFQRVPYEVAKFNTRREPIKVRCVDKLKKQRDSLKQVGGRRISQEVQVRGVCKLFSNASAGTFEHDDINDRSGAEGQ